MGSGHAGGVAGALGRRAGGCSGLEMFPVRWSGGAIVNTGWLFPTNGGRMGGSSRSGGGSSGSLFPTNGGRMGGSSRSGGGSSGRSRGRR